MVALDGVGCVDAPQDHYVASNSPRSELSRERPRQCLDTGLRQGIRKERAPRQSRCDGGDVDDDTAPLTLHDRYHRFRRQPHAAEIGVEKILPGCSVESEGVTIAAIEADNIDEGIDTAQESMGFVNQAATILRLRHVGHDNVGLASLIGNFCDRVLRTRTVDIYCANLGPLPSKEAANGVTIAGSRRRAVDQPPRQ